MYTAFISDTKTALSDLWTSVQAIHAQQTRNADNKVFQPAYAEAENLKLEADKKNLCAAASEKINNIMNRATEDAATLDEITPLDIDPDSKADRRIMELLSGKFTLNAAQLQALLDKFIPKDNRALLNAVRTFAEVRGMRVVAADTESRRAAIAEIRASALSVVSRIENTSYRNGDRDLSAGLSVENFCQDGDFAAELYGRLGQRFDGTIIPPVVTPENGGFGFSFRGVRDSDKKAG